MFKKIICLVLAIMFVVSLSACSGDVPETLTQTNNKDIIVLTKYSFDEAGSQNPNTEFDIPSNYIPISDDIYAELNETNEIVSYQKAVIDTATGKYI